MIVISIKQGCMIALLLSVSFCAQAISPRDSFLQMQQQIQNESPDGNPTQSFYGMAREGQEQAEKEQQQVEDKQNQPQPIVAPVPTAEEKEEDQDEDAAKQVPENDEQNKAKSVPSDPSQTDIDSNQGE